MGRPRERIIPKSWDRLLQKLAEKFVLPYRKTEQATVEKIWSTLSRHVLQCMQTEPNRVDDREATAFETIRKARNSGFANSGRFYLSKVLEISPEEVLDLLGPSTSPSEPPTREPKKLSEDAAITRIASEISDGKPEIKVKAPIFLLGAGASLSAGIPLGDELAKRIWDVLKKPEQHRKNERKRHP